MALISVGCGHVTHVRPTPKGKLAVEGAFGGPVAKVSGLTIPLPLTTLGASYGLSESADIHAHVHGTSLAFGVAGVDVGASYMPIKQQGYVPALTLTGRLYGFSNIERILDSRAYLELTGAGSYQLGKWFLLYGSASTFVQTQTWPLWSLAAGNEFQLGEWGLQLEGRWFQPSQLTRMNVVDWQSVGGLGAWGVVLGVRYRFDLQKGANL